MGRPLVDLTGKQFGHLRVLKQGKGQIRDDGSRRITWVCICSCGNKIEVQAGHLKSGHTQSCGCYQIKRTSESNKLPSNEAAKNQVLRRYKQHAKNRGYSFSITNEQFYSLLEQPCHYCGKKPSNRGKSGYRYQGIDRVDNKKGYTIDNVVPCCGQCNKRKGDKSKNSFLKLLGL